MTYEESVAYILSLTNLENTRNFEKMKSGFLNVERMLNLLGIDYFRRNVVHIAGTKGKGTVSYFTAYLLSRFCGQTVGLFTSPHLARINERIALVKEGKVFSIEDAEFGNVAGIVKKVKEENGVDLTTFDFLTVMAMYYFEKNCVDTVVLEVGLGGRLDSTNFCIPKVSVITLIDYDHTNVLGKSLRRIAYEKAGIIKPGVPVISASQRKGPKSVLVEVARRSGSEIKFLDEIYRVYRSTLSVNGTRASVRHLNLGIKTNIEMNLVGKQFVENFLLAYESAKHISEMPPIQNFQRFSFLLKGRFEVLRKKPLVVFDVAHTPKSVDVTMRNFVKVAEGKKFNLIVSLMHDKEIEKIARVISKYRNHLQDLCILRLQCNDGSSKLRECLTKLGFGRVNVLESLRGLVEGNYLIVGSFRIYGKIFEEMDLGEIGF